VDISTSNGMKTDYLLILGNLSSSSDLTHYAQEKRSRLSDTAYGDIKKVTINI